MMIPNPRAIRSIAKSSDSLVANPVDKGDRIAALGKQLGEAERPEVMISIDERHVGQTTIDPADQTELTLFCKETGFTVIDPELGTSQQAEYLIEGEGISEFATRHGNLISVKARLEVKVVDRASGKIVAVDRQAGAAGRRGRHRRATLAKTGHTRRPSMIRTYVSRCYEP